MKARDSAFRVNTPNRSIVSEIPHPRAVAMLERLAKVEARSMHGQLPVIWDRAENFTVADPWGNRWIDFTSTIFVANAGHGNPEVVDAIVTTARKPLLHSYTYLTQERLDYLEALVAATPAYLDKAFLVSSGTEAVEAAIKLMRMHSQNLGKRNSFIVSFEGNWHGRTMGAQLLSSNREQKNWIDIHDHGVIHLPFPYPQIADVTDDPKMFARQALETTLSQGGWTVEDDIAGFVFETFQGWGAYFYPADFVKEITQVARHGRALITFDEMQAGFGRTGEFFGFQHYGVEPDLVCAGKGTSSSVPLSFVLGKSELLDLPPFGSMSSTHSANPISCAAGLANLRFIEQADLVTRSRHLGRHFHGRLNAIAANSSIIESVQGRGLLAALIMKGSEGLSPTELATEVVWRCLGKGVLLVQTGRESIKMAPPLTISQEALDEGLDVIAEVVAEVEND